MEILSAGDIERFLEGWQLAAPPGGVPAEAVADANRRLKAFTKEQSRRLALTLALVPPAGNGDSLLEIGSAPYLMSLLLRHKAGYSVLHTNLSHDSRYPPPVVFTNAGTGAREEIRWVEFNAETDPFPCGDASVAVVMCCEIIEHLTVDPVRMLGEIHRVLAPGGTLVLTTPNALRRSHILDLSLGKNIHDRYRRGAAYGAYARHNREYTPGELAGLLGEIGFSVSSCGTADIYPPPRSVLTALETQWLLLPQRLHALVSRRIDARMDMKGDLVLVSARKTGRFRPVYPESIYYGGEE